jgi:hypothetical protein
MIKLTAQSGETVAVNPLHIFAVRPYQGARASSQVAARRLT